MRERFSPVVAPRPGLVVAPSFGRVAEGGRLPHLGAVPSAPRASEDAGAAATSATSFECPLLRLFLTE